MRNSFPRQVRLKAHKGEVVLMKHRGLDSADPEHFDDFLKHEKKFAPRNDEFFITDSLYHHLNETEKRRFQLFKRRVKGGSLHADLYRLHRAPYPKAQDILRRGDEISTIKQSDWLYLRDQITQHFKNIAARNQITKNLILHLSTPSGKRRKMISSGVLLESTLDALYAYTHIIFPDCRIRVSFWRFVPDRRRGALKMVSYRYPGGESTNPAKRICFNPAGVGATWRGVAAGMGGGGLVTKNSPRQSAEARDYAVGADFAGDGGVAARDAEAGEKQPAFPLTV